MFQIQSFTCEGLREHLVTDCAAPTFAYFVSSDRAGASVQSAELTVNGWTIRNPDQCGTRYAGQPLKPFTTYTATLTVTSDSGETDTARLTFETGRMDTPWQGKWITDGAYVFKEKKVSPVPMVFRKALPLRGEIAQAKLYATAMGIYELNIDGQKVGERYFAPGFTSYAHQLMYQTYDVTDMLHSGSCITATVAGGWAVGSFVFTRVNRVTADRQALLAELRITYRDGRTEVIGTDESWQVTEDGPVRMADFYDGETYDATVSLDKANWRSAVQERLRVKPKLMADYGADVKEHEKFAPVSCKKLGNALIYDFGQNFAGVVRLTVTGKRGQKITIRHSEVLNPDGTLNTAFLRTAKATATYICKDGKQTWSPRLTYMGFRYISVEGVREEDVQVTGVMLYSDIQQTGSFRCSNEMLNRLQENIVRSAKSNFMDIPTDCPQRDERMGWTGDIAVFAPTAVFNFDMNRFLDKWLLDVQAEQLPTGGLPNTVPVQGYGFPATMPKMAVAWWGDACVLVPWAQYMAQGDVDVLRRMYPTMKKYVNACRFWCGFGFGKHRYLWEMPGTLGFGDWVAPDVPQMSQWQGRGVAVQHKRAAGENRGYSGRNAGREALPGIVRKDGGCVLFAAHGRQRQAAGGVPDRLRPAHLPEYVPHAADSGKSRRESRRAGEAQRLVHRHGLPRHTVHPLRAVRQRAGGCRIPYAAEHEMPLVALRSQGRRDDDLGTLGRLGRERRLPDWR